MAENDTKDCPYCAEPVRREASICPHCRSSLVRSPASTAYRLHPGRQLAGVSIGLAEAFGVPVTLVRLAFIVATFFSFIGPPLYLVLWLLLPAEPGGQSPLGRTIEPDDGGPSIFERFVHASQDVFDRVAAWLRGDPYQPTSEPTESASTTETSPERAEGTS